MRVKLLVVSRHYMGQQVALLFSITFLPTSHKSGPDQQVGTESNRSVFSDLGEFYWAAK